MNPSFAFAADHWHGAVAIAEQRQSVLSAEEAHVPALLAMERLLRVHIHVLGRCLNALPAATSPAAAFVRWAALFQSVDEKRGDVDRLQAVEALAGKDAEAEGAFWALALFADATEEDALAALYRDHPEVRAKLFFLWHIRGSTVPQALIHQAVLKDPNAACRQAALAYAAAQIGIENDLFERFYAAGRPSDAPSDLAIAIWGGMVRGDDRADAALRHAIETVVSPDQRDPLLLLAALGGTSTLLPVLVDAFHHSPNRGALPLAIHGSPEAVGTLVDAMSRVETMQAAARVWPWVTGGPAPEKPRLAVAGDSPSTTHVGTMPDADKVQRIWRDIRLAGSHDSNDSTVRFLFGRPLDLKWLMALCRVRAGAAGGYLLDLLALRMGRPLGIHPAGWHHHRIALLDRIDAEDEGLTGERPC